jgi:hypothetical protein
MQDVRRGDAGRTTHLERMEERRLPEGWISEIGDRRIYSSALERTSELSESVAVRVFRVGSIVRENKDAHRSAPA